MLKYQFYLKNITKKRDDLAEFIGIMLGDGNMNSNAVTISFDKRNKFYIKYVSMLCNRIFSVNFKMRDHKTKNTGYLYFYSKSLVKNLIELGLKEGNKTKNKVRIPKWIRRNREYSKRCIKGLVDTDGSIYFCKRDKNYYIGFTNCSEPLLKDFRYLTNNLGYHFANGNKFNLCLYRKLEVVRFINNIKPTKAIKMGLSYNLD